MSEPGLGDPLMPDIAELYKNDFSQFKALAKEWTRRYATVQHDASKLANRTPILNPSADRASVAPAVVSVTTATTTIPTDSKRPRLDAGENKKVAAAPKTLASSGSDEDDEDDDDDESDSSQEDSVNEDGSDDSE